MTADKLPGDPKRPVRVSGTVRLTHRNRAEYLAWRENVKHLRLVYADVDKHGTNVVLTNPRKRK